MSSFGIWTTSPFLLAAFGGLVAGLVLQAIHPEYETLQPGRRAFLKGWMTAILGLLFYVGQEVSVVIHDGPVTIALHILSIFMRWLLFSSAVGLGAYVGYRLRRRSPPDGDGDPPSAEGRERLEGVGVQVDQVGAGPAVAVDHSNTYAPI